MDKIDNLNIAELKQAYIDLARSVQADNSLLGQANFKTLILNSPLPIYLNDFSGKIRLSNNAAVLLSGFSIDELTNMTIMDLDVQYNSLTYCLEMWNTMTFGEAVVFESKHKTKTNQVIDIEIHGVRMFLDSEEMVLGIVKDITQIKISEKEALRKDELLNIAQAMAKMGNWDYHISLNKLYWSREIYSIFEVDPTEFELNFDSYLSMVHPEDRAMAQQVFEEAFAENKPYQFTARIVTALGKVKYIEGKGDFETNEKGEVVSANGSVQDVSETVAIVNKLKVKDRFFEYAIDLFSISNFEGVFVELNPSWERELGWKPEEMLHQPWLKFVHPEDVQKTLDVFGGIKSGSEYFHFENRYLSKDGTYKWLSWNVYPYLKEKLIYSAARNITDRVESAEKLSQNNEMLHKLAAQVPGVVYQYQLFEDGKSCFPFSSPGMMDIYGFKPEEVETDATPVFGRLHSDDLERVSDAIFASARNQTLFDCEFRVNMPNMGVQWRQCNARPEKLDDGSTLWYGIITDITDRKLKEEIIARSEEKYRIVADNTYNWEFWEDEHGNMLYVSPACKKVTGYLAEEFISQSDLVQNIILPDDLSIFINHQEDVKNRRIHGKCTFRIITKSGEIKHIQHFCQPALDTNGNFRGVRGTNLDISESVSQINKIQSLLSLEEEQTKRMRSFTHIVSHNLRSHTANMQGLLTLLKEDYPAYFDNNYIQLLNQSAENLNQTLVHLNQVLNINMIEKKQWVKVNLKEYIQKAIDSISMIAKSSQVDIQVLVPAHLHLQTVPAYLESILLNLLTNGIKYASADRDSYLKFEAMVIQNQLHLSYSDNGIGIDLNRHGAAIFGMYKTFHGNKDSKGLGLFMTRNQVEAMGGKIEVESMVNIGTTFTITLPLVQPEMA